MPQTVRRKPPGWDEVPALPAAVGKVMDFLFPNDEIDPAGMVSLFGADKLARGAATKESMKTLKMALKALNLAPDEAAKITQIAKKYPRIMAHTSTGPALPAESSLAGTHTAWDAVPGLSMIQLRPSPGSIDPQKVARAFAHELTHSAQAIGLKERFKPLYLGAEEALSDLGPRLAYLENPFERSARAAASRRAPGLFEGIGAHPPVNVMAELRKLGIIK